MRDSLQIFKDVKEEINEDLDIFVVNRCGPLSLCIDILVVGGRESNC